MNSSICRADITTRFQFSKSSGYEHFDAARAKVEQATTGDMPSHALDVQIRQGALAVIESNSQAEQTATVGVLPAFAPRLSFNHKQTAEAEIGSKPPRMRQLLPAARTMILPAGDPEQLRALIHNKNENYSRKIENSRITARLQTLKGFYPQIGQKQKQSSSSLLLVVRFVDFALFGALSAMRSPLLNCGKHLRALIDSLALA